MYCRLQNKVKQETILVSYVKNNLKNKCALLLKLSNTVTYKEKKCFLLLNLW